MACRYKTRDRWHRWIRVLLLTLVLSLGLGLIAEHTQAQFSNPLGSSTNTPPLGVRRIGVLEVTAVTLDGNELFEIASPVVFNRNEPGTLVPVEVRARQIEINLNQVITQALDYQAFNTEAADTSETDLIQVTTEERGGLPVLVATVGSLSEPRGLVTVLDTDAQYYGTSKQALAQEWQLILQEALRQALDSRQPGAMRLRLRRVGLIALVSLLVSLTLAGIWQVLGWRKNALEHRQTLESNPPETGRSFQAEGQFLGYSIPLEQQLQLVAFTRWLMFWGIAFVWVSALAATLYLFPQTRRYASGLFSTPVLLLVIWFVSGLLNRVANIAIDRIAQAWQKNELGSVENIEHKAMRISTIIRAMKGLKTAVIYVLALLLLLQILKLAPVSLLAFGAVAALALSFAAQNLVKDLVNGFLILLEDQYAIGDLVTTGTTTGIVENLNLRITQIRGEDGRLVTLPNSLIAQVDNLSRTWSRATLTIDVAYGTNVDQALAVIRETAQAMAQDPLWGYAILNPTELVGVEAMSHAGLSILIWIRTRPLKQFLVAREFRRRLRLAFEQEGITIGIPQQQLSGLMDVESSAEGLPGEPSTPSSSGGAEG